MVLGIGRGRVGAARHRPRRSGRLPGPCGRVAIVTLASGALGAAEVEEVFPSSGPLFPDWDCRHAASAGGIDWPRWLAVYEAAPSSQWSARSEEFLEAFMSADEASYEVLLGECPLGVLNAEILLYVMARLQGDEETADAFAAAAQRGLRRFPLRVLAGAQWPLLQLLTHSKLRPLRAGGEDIFNDPTLNCERVPEPALHWRGFLGIFGDAQPPKDWLERSIRYVHSWQMSSIPDLLAEECPLGTLTATLTKAFTCATSESTCYRDEAGKFEAWLREEPRAFTLLAHSRWPLVALVRFLAQASRHRFSLDFTEAELAGTSASLEALAVAGHGGLGVMSRWGVWASSLEGYGHSQSFRDLIAALPRLGPGPVGGESLTYITMIYGRTFNVHMRRFCSRARALGSVGQRLLLFTLDDEAYSLCMLENGQRCVRGTPGIMNKFTLPLMCVLVGLDVVWIDLDVFLMVDPSPAILEHARRGPYDILISGSFEADCICNGIVLFRASGAVRTWLLGVLVWMYTHPYEHDQKTFSAFLNYTETVSRAALGLPPIPPWDTLDPINGFVTPDTFEGNGWSGSLEDIVIYHFLNGESDTGSDLDPSGSWMRDHGHFDDSGGAPPRCKAGDRSCGKTSLMDLFYGRDEDEELYTAGKPAYENPVLRRALLASRKDVRRTDLLGKPCGPMVGLFDAPPPSPGSKEALLQAARSGTTKAYGAPGAVRP